MPFLEKISATHPYAAVKMPPSKHASVLIVEDESDIAELMALHLLREGYVVTTTDNGEDALEKLSHSKFDLVVLDWMLPGKSGIEVCKELRSSGQDVGILMVTARAATQDVIAGLDAGADDYVSKPFENTVFLARARAVLRRIENPGQAESVERFQFEGLTVEPETYKVFCGKKEVPVTTSEFKLLLALVRAQGRVLTREKLMDCVQGEGVNVIDRTIDTHVFGLRKKLGACAELVETIRGVGYRLKLDK